jgi:hypothetical protein
LAGVDHRLDFLKINIFNFIQHFLLARYVVCLSLKKNVSYSTNNHFTLTEYGNFCCLVKLYIQICWLFWTFFCQYLLPVRWRIPSRPQPGACHPWPNGRHSNGTSVSEPTKPNEKKYYPSLLEHLH